MLERWLAVAGKGRTAPSLTSSAQQLQMALRWMPLPRVPVAIPSEGGDDRGVCLLPTPTATHRAPLCQPGHVAGV